MTINYLLSSKDKLTELAITKGITSWYQLTSFIEKLPYGRNKNRYDFELVLTENKGTCSSKHAFLKRIADLNDIPNISLHIGIYRMSELNTPKIGTILSDNQLDYIPEAHCY